jgi:hypothetical protein
VRSLVGEKLSARVLSGSSLGADFAHHIFESAAPAPADDDHGHLPIAKPSANAIEQRVSTPLSTPLQRLRISMSAPALAPIRSAADGACAAAGSAPAAGPSVTSATSLTAAGQSTVAGLRNLPPPPGTPALFRQHSLHAAPPPDSLETCGKCALASSQWHEVHPASLTAEAGRALREMRCADGSPLWAGMEEEEILAALEVGQLRCCPRYAVLMREGARAEAAFAILEGEVTRHPRLVTRHPGQLRPPGLSPSHDWLQPGAWSAPKPAPGLALALSSAATRHRNPNLPPPSASPSHSPPSPPSPLSFSASSLVNRSPQQLHPRGPGAALFEAEAGAAAHPGGGLLLRRGCARRATTAP